MIRMPWWEKSPRKHLLKLLQGDLTPKEVEEMTSILRGVATLDHWDITLKLSEWGSDFRAITRDEHPTVSAESYRDEVFLPAVQDYSNVTLDIRGVDVRQAWLRVLLVGLREEVSFAKGLRSFNLDTDSVTTEMWAWEVIANTEQKGE
ncbi:MAG: hypothetical protein OEY01_03495 [Desulfobulbaceae bacterium]|nr:hypothetical protein [Desulfobulbaceae bacterium]